MRQLISARNDFGKKARKNPVIMLPPRAVPSGAPNSNTMKQDKHTRGAGARGVAPRSLQALPWLALLLATGTLHAQTQPSAGSLLREQQSPAAPAAPRSVAPDAGARPAAATPGAGRLTVQRFAFEGNTRYSAEDLARELAGLTGRPLDFAQLSQALDIVAARYQREGWLARVFFPPQDVDNGVVRIGIVEARVGAVQPEGATSARAAGFIAARVAPGAALSLADLGAATTILNEQPGVRARTRLVTGATPGTTDIQVQAEESSRVSGTVEGNTFGSRATGIPQAVVAATFANPSGAYDQLGATAALSEGLRYGRIEYGRPLGSSGLRGSVNLAMLDYRLVQPRLAALSGSGEARTAGALLSYPLVRSERMGATGWFAFDQKLLRDSSLGAVLRNARIRAGTLGLSANFADSGSSNAGTDLSLALVHGEVDSADATDVRGTRGSFEKINWSVLRQQPLGGSLALAATFMGQIASKNLDPAERFALGGPHGIRAYPVGEAAGDEGLLLRLALQMPLSGQLTGSLFVEGGQVTLNRKVYAGWNAGNPNLPNRYTLAGTGAALDYVAGRTTFSAVIAGRLGKNPGRDLNNRDADGTHSSVRGWLLARYAF